MTGETVLSSSIRFYQKTNCRRNHYNRDIHSEKATLLVAISYVQRFIFLYLLQLQDTVRPILPPPPSSTKRGHLERQHTVPAPPASTTSSPATTLVSKTPPPQSTIHWFDKEAEDLFNDSEISNLSKNATKKGDQEDVSVNLRTPFVIFF